jgi:hypothetical protein
MAVMGPIELIILLFSGGLFAGLPAGVPPLPEDKGLVSAAPQECLLYFSFYGTAEANPASANAAERLVASPEVRAFMAELRRSAKAALSKAPADEQTEFLTQVVLPLAEAAVSRPCSLFVTKVVPQGPAPQVEAALVLNAGDQVATLRDKLNQIERLLAKQTGGDAREITVGGAKFRELPMPPGAPLVQWGFHNTYLVVGVGEGAAEQAVAGIKSARGPPPWLKQLHERLPVERPGAVLFVNVAGALQAAGPAIGPVQGILDTLGLSKVESISSVTGLGANDMVSATLIATSGPPSGVFELLFDEPLTSADLANIPRDATWAMALRCDLAKAYSRTLSMVDDINPQARAQFQAEVAQAEQQLGFRIVNDLLQPLGDVWTVYNSPGQGGFLFTGATLTARLDDRPTLQRTNDQLLRLIRREADPEIIQQFTFGDHTVYYVNAGLPIAPAWCLTSKELAAALYPQQIRTYLAAAYSGVKTESLAMRPEVQELLRMKPSMVSFQDTPELFRTFYPLVQMMAPVATGALKESGFSFDVSAVPSAAAIYPHLRPSVAAIARTDQGLRIVTHQTLPALGGGPGTAAVALGLLLPAVQKAREAAVRTQAMNNLRQLAIAMHNHHDVHGRFPAPANYDANGKPLLSWRVHILPYLEQDALYRKFKLDEPWDSPHNKALIKEMPELYTSPGGRPLGQGLTCFLAPAGEATLFPKGKQKQCVGVPVGQVTDGTSKTIMIVEAAPEKAVIWTKPDDLPFDERNPRAGLFGMRPGIVLVSMADGSVRTVSESISSEMLKALLTRSGGEPVSPP